jgi:hypothetical protein
MSNRQKSLRLALAGLALVLIASVVFTSPWSGPAKAAAEDSARSKTAGSELVVGACDVATAGLPIEVESVSPASGPTAYANLQAAFAAINAGTHQGTISVEVCFSSVEPAGSAVLNSNAAAPAAYTSVSISPLADGLTISGASAAGRGLIELNGADSVTMDGDNPNSGGTNRNLTLQNTAVSTTTYAQVVRIALATTVITSADNNTIKNLNILGHATGRNAVANTSTTGSENASYGIYASGSASTVSQTTAPTAITSVSTTIGTGATASNLTIQNIFVTTAARAIAGQGSATTVFPGLLIENNTIGNSTAGATDQVYSMGTTIQGSTNAIYRGNTVYVESFLGSAIRGPEFGSISATGSGAIFENNKVLRVRNNSASSFGSYGINLGGGNNHIVRNNFVADIRNDQTAGTGAFSTTFGAFGLRIATGTGHIVYHNSVHLFGAMPGVVSTDLVAAIGIVATTSTGMDIRNNIFSNQLTGGNPTGTTFSAVYMPSGATVSMNLTWNNNAYYGSSDVRSRLAQTGTTFGAGEFTVANFNPSVTTPAANFRAYTAPLSAAGTNDNASFATISAPPFTSGTDLHIPAATVTLLESGGAAVGLLVDIDGDVRPNGTAPDIGADEFAGVPPPANDIAANAFITPPNGGTVFVGSTPSPQASFSNVGTATQTSIGVQFNISGPGGYAYTDNQVIASLANGATTTVTFAAVPAFTTAGAYTMSAVVTTADANIGNNSIAGGFSVSPLASGGPATVGTGGTYASLTNPGGVFEAINSATVTSNVDIQIVSNLSGETGAVALNEIPGGFTVTIRPTGAARTVTGTSATGMIPFAGADNVTINGSLTPPTGTDRSLTFTNTGGGGGITFSTGASLLGAQNNTVKNTNVWGGSSTATVIGIAFQGNTFGSAGADNDNNRVENCDLRSSIYGIYSVGASTANKNTGVVITKNVMTGTGAARIGRIGIFTGFDDGVQITENQIDGINSAESADAIAIGAGSQGLGTTAPTPVDQINAFIARNRIGVVSQTNTFSVAGIVVASGAGGANTVQNNMISGVIGNANAGDFVAGIYVVPVAGATQNIWYNSVSNSGARGATASQYGSFCLAISADQPINIRNNIFYNAQTQSGGGAGGRSYAIGTAAATFANMTSNHNDLFVTGAQATLGITGGLLNVAGTGTGTDRIDLAAWQAATGQDTTFAPESVSVDPLFVSLTDLHLQGTSTMLGAADATVGVNNDFDNDLRDNVPDIGADEIPTSGRSGTIPAGTYRDGRLLTSTLGGNVDFTGVLTFGGGQVNAGAFTLGLTCTGSTTGENVNNYVIGNFRRDFCSNASYLFPVGTTPNGSALAGGEESGELSPEGFTGEYSPMTATINAGTTFPASLTVNVVDTWLPNLGQTSSISRYWNVSETGTVNADMLFQYLPEDVYGDEPNYKPFKWDGASTTQEPGSVDAPNNQFTATGVTSFSGWAAGVRNVTASTASISGRVTTANGNGIRNANMILTGNSLPAPIIVQTGSFGTYSFDNLRVGETYILQVGAKRFRFTNPTHVITLQGEITDMDFVANPQE